MRPTDIERIRLRAYEIYKDGGRGMQSALEDWLQAEWECSSALDVQEPAMADEIDGFLPRQKGRQKGRENGQSTHRPGTGVSDRE